MRDPKKVMEYNIFSYQSNNKHLNRDTLKLKSKQ